MLGEAYGLILFVMRDQTTVPALLDEDIAVDNEDTDLANIDGIAFFNKNLVSIMVGWLHAVTADRNHEVRLLRFLGFGNKNLLGKLAVKDIARACRSRKRVIIHSQHTALGFPDGRRYSPVLAVDQIIHNFFTVFVKDAVFFYRLPFGSRRAFRQFNEQDANTYTTLMKATIAEAIGFDGSDDEKELLERQVNGLNDKMIAIVNESIASGEDIESREAEIKEIADTIEDLKRRIQIITESSMKNAEYADRIAEIERIITERASHQNEYDDSIVRQMVECIKVYADKHIEVIFGGGYAVEETVE